MYIDFVDEMIHSGTIYTIGHSTHTLDDFVAMLNSFDVKLLADIRAFPSSKRYPHFNKENLSASLASHNIEYLHFPGLGGRRKPLPDSHNKAWKISGFRGYADYMETAEFVGEAAKLEKHAARKATAYMCSEAVWWSCHRSLLSDYYKSRGWKVLHIMAPGKSQEHPYTKPARIVGGTLTYGEPGLFNGS